MQFFKRLELIKALSFDLDDTLYDNVPVMQQAESVFEKYIQQRFALQSSQYNLSLLVSKVQEIKAEDSSLNHDVTLARAYGLMACLLDCGIKLTLTQALECVSYFIKIRSQLIEVPYSTHQLLKKLQQHYPLLAISNGNSDSAISGLSCYFSYDLRPSINTGRSKPYADLFLQGASLLGIEPYEILHIGDDPYTDVYGAVNAGLQSAFLSRGIANKGCGPESLKILPQLLLERLDEILAIL